MLLKGASILVECLKEQKVDTVFGYPGGAVLEIYDELYKHQSEIPPYPHVSRARGGTRGGWICQGNGKNRCLHSHFGTWGDQSGNGNRHSVYGLHSHGGHHGKRGGESAGKG